MTPSISPARSAHLALRPLGRSGDLGWVVMAHGELYTTEFGWDASFEALVARIVADYGRLTDDVRAGEAPPQGAWIAELDGRRAGCVFCVPGDEPGTAKLRLLLVQRWARGQGLGPLLVDRAIEFARRAGYTRMRLWTNHPLAAARRIYLSRGFELIDEETHHSFGVELIGQTYELQLAPEA